ncbi:MAG: hypothetical protein ACQEP8_01220 [Chlamydiota bacterium]
MLSFCRKYQKIIFYVVTFVVVISFSFFGTYSALSGNNHPPSRKAFTAINRRQFSTDYLNKFVNFIGSDAEDALNSGSIWTANFLNDGVIVKDILSNGLGEMLFAQYREALKGDLQTRLAGERRYTPYYHPDVPTLNAETIWGYFAPELRQHYHALKKSTEATTPRSFHNRVMLYLAERQFPQQLLRQVLAYQQGQYSWLPADPNLQRLDLALFGYHNLKDWFGPRFMDLVGEFIINASIIAEDKGYNVSDEEVMADLLYNLSENLKAYRQHPQMAELNEQTFFSEQLRRLNIDQRIAVDIWKRVMLFRRMFDDVGNAMFAATLPYEEFQEYASETSEVEAYFLPGELQLADYSDLQKFEAYLQAVAPRYSPQELSLPTKFKDPTAVAQNHPELVKKRYLVELSSADKKSLQAKVGVRETSQWQLQNDNWQKLQDQFPIIGSQPHNTAEEKLQALNTLDPRTKELVDEYTREHIVAEHPEWLEESLQQASKEQQIIALTPKENMTAILKVADPAALIEKLDKAPLNSIVSYTPDNDLYYNITILDRSPQYEILTFGEAINNKSFNSWASTVEQENFLNSLTEAIYQHFKKHSPQGALPAQAGKDFAASHRLYHHVHRAKQLLLKGDRSMVGQDRQQEEGNLDSLPSKNNLADQWALASQKLTIRREERNRLNPTEVFALPVDEWSIIATPADGGMRFFYVEDRYYPEDSNLKSHIQQGQRLLGNDAQRYLMQELIKKIEAAEAISLDYYEEAAAENE